MTLHDWRLFLDDERYPPDTDIDWVLARTVDDAVWYVKAYGVPSFMSLDHDMGYGKLTGKDFANWIVGHCQECGIAIPDFYVHSMNPVGSENIRKYLENAQEFLDGDRA